MEQSKKKGWQNYFATEQERRLKQDRLETYVSDLNSAELLELSLDFLKKAKTPAQIETAKKVYLYASYFFGYSDKVKNEMALLRSEIERLEKSIHLTMIENKNLKKENKELKQKLRKYQKHHFS